MASPNFLSGGHTPNRLDTLWTIEQRILGALVDGAGGGGADLYGVVDPEGSVTGSRGNSYINTANHTLWFKETGDSTNTGWAQYV